MATITWYKRTQPCRARVGAEALERLGYRAVLRNVLLTRPAERYLDLYGAFQPRFEMDRRSACALDLACREESA